LEGASPFFFPFPGFDRMGIKLNNPSLPEVTLFEPIPMGPLPCLCSERGDILHFWQAFDREIEEEPLPGRLPEGSDTSPASLFPSGSLRPDLTESTTTGFEGFSSESGRKDADALYPILQ
jgi:hypothetical protein